MSAPTRLRRADADPAARAAIVQRLKQRTMAVGSLSGPCLPALADHYLKKALQLFDVMDRPLEGEELATFCSMFRAKVEEGFAASRHARFILSYRPDESNPSMVSCSMSAFVPSLEDQITEWVSTAGADEPFGKHPDAKVLDVARDLDPARGARLLDVGAGTGRNSIPLARLGFAVDAIEPVPAFAANLRACAERERLPLAVIEADVLEPGGVPQGPYDLVILSEVVTHFAESELDQLMPNLARAIGPRGRLLFNAFVPRNGYEPDALAKQAGCSLWSTLFTRAELDATTRAAGLEIVSDESAIAYEKAHWPRGAWPPTPWYVPWAEGHNLFSPAEGIPPIELRWLLYRRQS